MNRLNKTLALAVATALGVPAGSALAQQAGAGRLDEITVTARKVEENLQRVPVSVTALTAEDIATRGVEGLSDVARFTAGFSFEDFSGPLAAPIIRGQTQTRIDLPVQNVASYFNGVYLQRNYMIDASLLEMARIEIIKGPQSALYGRNAFSGAINYVPRRAGDALEVTAQGTLGSYDRRDLKGSISGPLGDTFGFLLAAGHSEYGGSWQNNHPLASQGTGTKDRLGGYDNQSALVALDYTPTDALSFQATWSWSSLDVEAKPQYSTSTPGLLNNFGSLNCSPRTDANGLTANRLYCGKLGIEPELTAAELDPATARPPGLLVDPRSFSQLGTSRLGTLATAWEINQEATLNYVFGYTNTNVNSSGSPARNPLVGNLAPAFVPFLAPIAGRVGFDSQPNGGFTSRSHEVRLEWQPEGVIRRASVGAFTSRSRDDASAWSRWAQPLALTPPEATFTFQNQTRRDSVESVFGLMTIDLSARFAITGELRYNEEELQLDARATSPGFIPLPLDSSAPIIRTQTDKFDYWTPRLALEFQATDDNLLYVSIGKGVKGGGQNVPGRDPVQDTYKPEENWTLELGSKNDLLDGTLRANAAIYYIDWTGIQGSVARNYPTVERPDCITACAPPAPGTPVPVIVGNLGDATVYGIELDGAWLLSDAWQIDYAFAFQRARYKSGLISQRLANAGNCDGVVCETTVRNALGQPIDGARIGGNQLERQPEIQGALGLQYDFTLGGMPDMALRARADLTWQDKQYVDELNLAWTPARTLVDASLTADWGNFTGRVWAKNLLDEKYVSASLFLAGTDGALSASYVPFLGERRTVGVTLGWSF
jgi:iron complex outermembrane receptor protein